MSSRIDIAKLVNSIVEAYNIVEFEGFLRDYFNLRLDVVINPQGIGLIEAVRSVVEYFERRGNLTDLVREFGKDRPGKVNLAELFVTSASSGSSGLPTSGVRGASTGLVEIEPDEVDFYFLIEPDRRTVPGTLGNRVTNDAIYVRIPIVGSSLVHRTGLPFAFSLALDRSGSMQGRKIEVARAAADYILDIASSPAHRVAILAFDDLVETVVPIQQINSPSVPKAAIRRITPRGQTDLFSAWTEAVQSLRTVDRTWDRRAVLITDGQLNRGMVDPKRFADEVARTWLNEGIATSCISMGDDWNVNLLNDLASHGGGTIQFINDVSQAVQALHEAFQMRHGTVACNIHANIRVIGTAQVTQVQGVSCSLAGGQTKSYHLANHLRTNVEEELILRVEFAAPQSGEAVDLLMCSFSYETATGEQRKSLEKTLRIIGEDTSHVLGKSIVNQGVVCSAHSMMAHHCFREALTGFLHGNREVGREMLERARLCLDSGPTPRAYLAHVEMCDQRITDLAQFDGNVPAEYIKRKYIDELSHKDVVWIGLCQLLDHMRFNLADTIGERQVWDTYTIFEWALNWVSEHSNQLPIQSGAVEPNEQMQSHHEERLYERQEEASRKFWQNKLRLADDQPITQRDRDTSSIQENNKLIIEAVAGSCCAFEMWQQGTREELGEVMDSYLRVIKRNVG